MSGRNEISIANFRKVNDRLYRGGQPRSDEYEQLRELGIKTVICLRWNSREIKKEREIATALGLSFFAIPLTYWFLPTNNEIGRFFEIVDNQDNQPVFVHCKHGSDRTGMLVAFYRMARESWHVDKAYREMKEAGFHRFRMHHFKYAVYGYAKRLASK